MQETGKLLAYILRHNPEHAGVQLDNHGYADVDALIAGIRKRGRQIDFDTLCKIVETDEKGRFSFNADRTKLRANQGHSIAVDPELEEALPSEVLYHGTAERFLASIEREGLTRRSRNFVHLSKDEATAKTVGKRHGEPVVLVVNTNAMLADGFIFYISSNGVWLTERVPFKYITEIKRQ